MNKDLLSLRLYMLGCGNMGKALLESWLRGGIAPGNVTARTASGQSAADLMHTYAINAANTTQYDGQDVVVLAVKPQLLPEALAGWNISRKPLYISLAAGITLAGLKEMLGEDARIIRAMPNTPSKLGKGMTILVGDVSQKDKAIADSLFNAAGKMLWLKDETQMDAATAIAGSGPAYFFHFAESLVENAVRLGFPSDEARLLVSQTLSGSAALAEDGAWDVAGLRQAVTSKAGVTEAALDILMPALTPLIEKAFRANIERSRQLQKN